MATLDDWYLTDETGRITGHLPVCGCAVPGPTGRELCSKPLSEAGAEAVHCAEHARLFRADIAADRQGWGIRIS